MDAAEDIAQQAWDYLLIDCELGNFQSLLNSIDDDTLKEDIPEVIESIIFEYCLLYTSPSPRDRG